MCVGGSRAARRVRSWMGLLLLALPSLAPAQPLALIDVPYLSQTEALCGGAAAAMVLRYWGERGLAAESFAHLVNEEAGGIETTVLAAELDRRGWDASGVAGDAPLGRAHVGRGRPVIALIEDAPGRFHYVVVVAWPDRAVVFHDPARAPFRVLDTNEFERRWQQAGHWMMVPTPRAGSSMASPAPPAVAAPVPPPPLGFDATNRPGGATCASLVEEGIRSARGNDLDAAERSLLEALTCPGGAAQRELAGVRLLQKRWTDVTALAAAAVVQDPADAYAWKLLGTGRFLDDDRPGALRAWNQTGEPRLDLVRIDGLTRTRHQVVERLMQLEAGRPLTPRAFQLATRRLDELPAATASRLTFVPVPSGQVEVRGSVTERTLFPSGAVTWGAIGIMTAATRELRITTGSLTGGGESVTGAWRFRPNRPRVALGVLAPAPWGGVWGVDGFAERQEFDVAALDPAERLGGSLSAANWLTGSVRWEARAGVDRWETTGALGTVGGGLRVKAAGDRVEAAFRTDAWFGDVDFATTLLRVDARSRREYEGTVLVGTAALQTASTDTPLDIWPGSDAGMARPSTLRAHPLFRHGRLRVGRIGRSVAGLSMEAQRWTAPRLDGRVRAAGAVFVDTGTTRTRLTGGPLTDVDLGVGVRFAVTGISGVFRADVAKGLRDGSTFVSFAYIP